jgi:hypothetical protein
MGALAAAMGCACLFILRVQDTFVPAYYNRIHTKLALSLILEVTGFRERSSPISISSIVLEISPTESALIAIVDANAAFLIAYSFFGKLLNLLKP